MKHFVAKIYYWLFNQDGKKFLQLVLFIIVTISIYLVFAPPYIGMANNGIFQTIIQNVGIDYSYNLWDKNVINDSFFAYVVNSFIITEPIDNGSYTPFEINVKFSRILSELFSKTGHYDLRFMGLSNLIFYIIVLVLLFYAVSLYSKKIIYLAGSIILLIACDTYIIQYFNSFYVELGTLLYIIAFFALTLIYIKSDKKNKILCYLFEIPIAILIGNMMHRDNILLIPLFILLFVQGIDLIKKLNKNKVYIFLLFFIITISLIVPSIWMNIKNKEGENKFSYNIIMKTMLPLSNNPTEQLQNMGFNDYETKELVKYLNQTAGENSGFEKYGDRFNRLREIIIIKKEPYIGFQILKQNAVKLFITNDHIGNFLKEENLPNSKNKFSSIWSMLKHNIYRSNIWFYFAIIGFTVVISLFYIIKERKKIFHEFFILFILCIVNLLQFIAISFYDAFNNEIRDYFVVNVVFDIISLCMLFFIVNLIINYLIKNLRISIHINSIETRNIL